MELVRLWFGVALLIYGLMILVFYTMNRIMLKDQKVPFQLLILLILILLSSGMVTSGILMISGTTLLNK